MHLGLFLQGGQSWLGGVDYIRNLVVALGNLPLEERADLRVTLLTDGPVGAELENALRPHIYAIADRVGSLPRRSLANRIVWYVRRHVQGENNPRFSQFCQATGINFFYPYHPYQGRPKRRAGFGTAAWIPDFQHKHLPHFFTTEEIRQRESYLSRIVTAAPQVVLSSESAAVDFHSYYPEQSEKARILRFAVWPEQGWLQGDPLATQAIYGLPDRFFLICNQFWQHKNHLLVFEVLRQLREQGVRPELVCTGHLYDYRRPDFADEILQTIHRFGLNTQVRLLGIVPREHQIQLMRRCLAVIQPSLFEGWSTVVEFAKTLGCPLILSDLPVHREQCPDGIFFRRDSADDLADLVDKVWHGLESVQHQKQESEAHFDAQSRAIDFARTFLALANETCF